jgi:isopentenyldiphosphate isomerase
VCADEAPEIASLVDRDGTVVGSAPRAEVRRRNLLHAATAVLVRRSTGEIYLTRRSATKDWAPGQHDCSAGGVLLHGEDPAASALREVAEELGITGVARSGLRSLGTALYEDATVRCVEHCYELVWDGPVHHADGEVVWGRWVTLGELDQLLRDPSFRLVPDTRALLARLARADVGDYANLRWLAAR